MENSHKYLEKIILGSVQFGLNYGINNNRGQVPYNEVVKILQTAHKKGIRLIDTSSAYGNSELVLGKAIAETKLDFNIISKYPKSDKDVETTIELSFKNLGKRSLYGYLVHHFDLFLEQPKIYSEIVALKRSGLIKKSGFSIYNTEQLLYLLDNNIEFELIQFPYNLLDRQFDPFLPILRNKGVEIHTRSAFLQGLFFKDLTEIPQKLIPLKKYLKKIREFCTKNDTTIERLALGFCLTKNEIGGVLIGVDSNEQFKSNLLSISKPLDNKEIDFFYNIDVKENDLLSPINW